MHEMQGVYPAIIRLQRQVSYFGDHDGVNGLLRHVQEDEFSCQVLKMLWDGRTDEDIPYCEYHSLAYSRLRLPNRFSAFHFSPFFSHV
jgi:hypothetical protein